MKRLTVALTAVVVFFGLFAWRLYDLQIVNGAYYAALLAERAESDTEAVAARGDILDRHGVRLSTDRVAWQVTSDGQLSREAAAELLTELGETVTARGDVLCDDASHKTVAVITSQPERYRGLHITAVPTRQYEAKTVAAGLLGTVGPLYAEEYETLRDEGYRLTDRIGKSGIERAYEAVLRGRDGVAGASVELTLDSRLQARVEELVGAEIARLRREGEALKGRDVVSGAAVLLTMTGEVLACVSCPTYDLSTYSAQYTALCNDPDRPLFNRALWGTFPCGSVIKPAVALAAITEEVQTDVVCDGVYRYYEEVGFAPKCMGRHGAVDAVTALQKSCNVYFMDLGRLLGIERLNAFAAAFGLGSATGIEIGEARGVLSSPDNKGNWVAGDTCQCAIGQLTQRFTPLQLAAYVMTLANGGVRYRVHMVRRILEPDGRCRDVTAPQVMAKVALDEQAKRTVRDGMVAVTRAGGTAYEAFRGATYTVAAKTGTAQHQKGRSDHGVFIAYAPVENPQVALAVVMENGTSAAASAVARAVLDAYFVNLKNR